MNSNSSMNETSVPIVHDDEDDGNQLSTAEITSHSFNIEDEGDDDVWDEFASSSIVPTDELINPSVIAAVDQTNMIIIDKESVELLNQSNPVEHLSYQNDSNELIEADEVVINSTNTSIPKNDVDDESLSKQDIAGLFFSIFSYDLISML